MSNPSEGGTRGRSDPPTSASAARRPDAPRSLGAFSSVLHRIGDVTSLAVVANSVIVAVVVVLVALALTGFPERWQFVFATTASAVTLMMVFVIQHTQSRQQLATQLKLDELIRTSATANDLLVHIESAEHEELQAIEQDQLDHHSTLRNGYQ